MGGSLSPAYRRRPRHCKHFQTRFPSQTVSCEKNVLFLALKSADLCGAGAVGGGGGGVRVRTRARAASVRHHCAACCRRRRRRRPTPPPPATAPHPQKHLATCTTLHPPARGLLWVFPWCNNPALAAYNALQPGSHPAATIHGDVTFLSRLHTWTTCWTA